MEPSSVCLIEEIASLIEESLTLIDGTFMIASLTTFASLMSCVCATLIDGTIKCLFDRRNCKFDRRKFDFDRWNLHYRITHDFRITHVLCLRNFDRWNHQVSV